MPPPLMGAVSFFAISAAQYPSVAGKITLNKEPNAPPRAFTRPKSCKLHPRMVMFGQKDGQKDEA